jgi:hypothetical protein
MDMINSLLEMVEDPMTLLYYAPIVLGILYLIASIYGETGK